MDFEWNDTKSAINKIKHSVSFMEAVTVFSDDFGRLIIDPDHSSDEDRFLLLGMSVNFRLLVVSHCIRENESIRLISARIATRAERKQYEGEHNA